MVIDVRYHSVKILPNGGTLHAAVRCKNCSHKITILEPFTKDKVENFKQHAICSKCHKRNFSIDVFELTESETSQTKFSGKKKCIVCGIEIAESTLFALPHTKCCSDHLDSNPAVIPKVDEPLGTREDFKKDSASNWSRAQSNKL